MWVTNSAKGRRTIIGRRGSQAFDRGTAKAGGRGRPYQKSESYQRGYIARASWARGTPKYINPFKVDMFIPTLYGWFPL